MWQNDVGGLGRWSLRLDEVELFYACLPLPPACLLYYIENQQLGSELLLLQKLINYIAWMEIFGTPEANHQPAQHIKVISSSTIPSSVDVTHN